MSAPITRPVLPIDRTAVASGRAVQQCPNESLQLCALCDVLFSSSASSMISYVFPQVGEPAVTLRIVSSGQENHLNLPANGFEVSEIG